VSGNGKQALDQCYQEASMFDSVRRHSRVLQFVLVLLIFPSFVVFGIQGYQSFAEGNTSVARVDGRDITQVEWDNAHRNQIQQLQQRMPGADPKLFDAPEFKQRTLEGLVQDRVLFAAAHDQHLSPTDAQLARFYQTDPNYTWLIQADKATREGLLAARGLNEGMLDAQVRQELAMRQVLQGVGGSTLATSAAATAALNAFFQQREVQVALFSAKDQMTQVQVSDAEVQAYYADAAHASQFMAAESVAVEYLLLDLAAVSASVSVSDEELRKYYDENAARYGQPEERRARHILVKTGGGADKAQAKAKAESLLAELSKGRDRFVDLARKSSDDPDSGAKGGDLDWSSRGGMVSKALEDAVFGLKKGELAATAVESEFGFHIVELTDVRGGGKRSFDSVRSEIEAEVKKQLAQRRFADAAEQFTNLVEQEDSLQPVATRLKLELRRQDNLTRAGAGAADALLGNPKVLEAVFRAQNLAGKRNTEVVETAANQLFAAHVLKHVSARKKTLEEVKDQARIAVQFQKAAAAAKAEGEARLKDWRAKPEQASGLAAPVLHSRAKQAALPPAIADAVLRAPTSSLPGWLGVDLGAEGYAVVKLLKVADADPAALGDPQQSRSQYAQLWSRAETDAYLKALRQRYKAQMTAKPAAAATGVEGAASR
jgi:peptidyl-prolyl cis-trans isomerase D